MNAVASDERASSRQTKATRLSAKDGRSTRGNEALCRREMRPSRAMGGKQPTKVRSGDGRFRYVPIKARDSALLGRPAARVNRQRS